jgi:hypothetical protein
MVNNRHLIEPLLEFPHKEIFYFVQILSRKKDNPKGDITGSSNNSRLIKAYFITSLEKLDKQWEEMVELAKLFNARVSINLNPRNFQKAAFHTLQKIANQMSNGDFYNIHKAFTSICGEYHSEIDKRWLIDIDKEEMHLYAEIKEFVNNLHSEIKNKDYKILADIPSKSGMHIISHPFNLDLFSKKFPTTEVHKNNPTSLFCP